MIRIILPFLVVLGLPVCAMAGEPDRLIAVPLQTSGVSAEIAKGYDQHVRSLVAKKSRLVARKASTAALSKAGAKTGCAEQTCQAKLAASSKARFILSGRVDSEDEIYNVELWLYDGALKKRSKGSAVCELCAAQEVKTTLAKAISQLGPALAAPPPKKKPPVKKPPPKPTKPLLRVTSTPEGAQVLVDGTQVGVTPMKASVEPGKHIVVIQKDGFTAEERTVSALGKVVTLQVELKEVAKPPTPTPPPPVATAPVTPTPAAPAAGGFGGLGWGFAVGGVVLAGAGTFLVILDGTVTCDDDRGRMECPTVYNTKGMGIIGLGVGAALLGSGVTLLVVDPGGGQASSAASIAPTSGGAVVRWGGRF